jgi:hypothetical protein
VATRRAPTLDARARTSLEGIGVGLAKATSMPKGTGMKMEIDVLSVGRAIALAASVAAVIALVLLAWVGGELHYGNCLANAELRYPAAYGPTRSGNVYLEATGEGRSGPPRFVFYDRAHRSAAIDDCSRWP